MRFFNSSPHLVRRSSHLREIKDQIYNVCFQCQEMHSNDTSSLDRNQPLTPSFQSPMFFPVPVSSLPSELCPTVQRFNATVPNFHFNVLSVVAATAQNRKVAMMLHSSYRDSGAAVKNDTPRAL